MVVQVLEPDHLMGSVPESSHHQVFVHGEWLVLWLTGGSGPCSGRQDVLCQSADDLWDLNEAKVVCRQLSCGRAFAALGKAHFGPGCGVILLDNVQCSGAKRHLDQ
ncbi:hypothetical protein QTO34_005731 [Cnephaeus nilssonii]|uniref:SRCR domain-containing protein n=1 Tax=Cnephaeus nilssonii TaxID=3371016 RepID=A0AA40HLD4_CNENI|nr:hypothetical protein QTO34_005731 [Eptesicus nilssonii]